MRSARISFDRLLRNLNTAKSSLRRPLTLSEKLLYSHLDKPSEGARRGDGYLQLKPDRLATHDAAGQMALLQFISSGIEDVALPMSIHCDHLIAARREGQADVRQGEEDHREVFDFLASAAQRYGLDFWRPGSGIIHQILLENYVLPGMLLIATDSHTPNAGGLGALGIGVGGADIVDAMAGMPWELLCPKVIGVRLTGELEEWTAPKDVILTLTAKLGVQGGTGCIIEYFGEGVSTLSCTGMATICNMGAEVGATSSVFPYNHRMAQYLKATDRSAAVRRLDDVRNTLLCADEGCEYDDVIEINLSDLQPCINGPFTPDRCHTLAEIGSATQREGWPVEISAALIGSCTNSSYEDMSKAASIARQASARGLQAKCPFHITPGSEQIRLTMERDGIADAFRSIGGVVLANACGPCIGQWHRSSTHGPNSIVSSYNRNFSSRNDGNALTHAFLASPEVVTALALAGRLDFNPTTDELLDSSGVSFRLSPPSSDDLPELGYVSGSHMLSKIERRKDTEIKIDGNSQRIQLLQPFDRWDVKDIHQAPILIKVRGKCTTDHISPAGPWFRYRGHLDNLSNNMLIGATNDANGKCDRVQNVVTMEWTSVPDAARYYKSCGMVWVIVADSNYGEGSSREHAALSPRHLGCVAVIARGFARIHETNLKKQGILPLWFIEPMDYDSIQPSDRVTLVGLESLTENRPIECKIERRDAEPITMYLEHSLNDLQISWFKAGSALNLMKAKRNCLTQ